MKAKQFDIADYLIEGMINSDPLDPFGMNEVLHFEKMQRNREWADEHEDIMDMLVGLKKTEIKILKKMLAGLQ